jgi:hypothetical protein
MVRRDLIRHDEVILRCFVVAMRLHIARIRNLRLSISEKIAKTRSGIYETPLPAIAMIARSLALDQKQAEFVETNPSG